jgi:diacylglycerol kinase family enzyme
VTQASAGGEGRRPGGDAGVQAADTARLIPWRPVRALLLYNPNATTTSPVITDVIAHAFGDELKLEVEATKRRDHASYLAAGAVHEGFDVVVALGGDGTVNEIMQGLVHTPVKLAIIPGGSTNVWARTLGLPNDAVEATSAILRSLREGRDRVVNLGSANGRYFGFNAGFGFDAEAVRYVEERYLLKRTVKQASFLYCGMLAYFGAYRRRQVDITLETGDQPPAEPLRSVVCCNSNPFTFLGPRPAQVCPRADLDKGLDVAGLVRWRMPSLLRLVHAALTSADVERLRSVRMWHDLDAFTLRNPAPLPLQVDGDYIGDAYRVEFRSIPRALTVVA